MKCEMSTAASDRLGKPIVVHCPNDGTLRENYGIRPFGAVMCDDCYANYVARRKE